MELPWVCGPAEVLLAPVILGSWGLGVLWKKCGNPLIFSKGLYYDSSLTGALTGGCCRMQYKIFYECDVL